MNPDGPARILIVEDEESLADSIRYNLEREGYTVEIAGDGRRALEAFRSDGAALVILDLMLPEVSGLDVCRTIREESDVPIIMVTAKDAEADKVAGLELGADEPRRTRRSSREARWRWTLLATKPRLGGSTSTSPQRNSPSSSSFFRGRDGCSPAISSSTRSGAPTTTGTRRHSTFT
jgi:CheY-like chemotaxis protein